jgi:diaminopimelate decarboxylase
MEIVKLAISLENVKLVGLHCHIGSQIFDIEPFSDAADIMSRFIAKIKAATATTIALLCNSCIVGHDTL